MSLLDDAINRMRTMVDLRMQASAPFSAEVTSVSGKLATISRRGALTADAEAYVNATGNTLTMGDQVLCIPVNGKPVIVGTYKMPVIHPQVKAAGAFVGTAYSSGDTTVGTPALVLDGLVPSAMYQVKMDGQMIANGSGGAATGSFGFNINGATPTPYGNNVTLPITRGAYPLAWGGAFAADANGEISVKARVVCDSGTIWVDAVYLTAILVDQ